MSDVIHRIGPGMEVTLHFSVLLADGTLMDSTREGPPATFVFGDGNLMPGFEHSIRGLKAGDRRSVSLTPEKAFGLWREENQQYIDRTLFAREMALEPGLVVSFADHSGAELPGVVKALEGDRILVDFNHPLAGRELLFEVDVLRVRDANNEQVVSLSGGTAAGGTL